MSRPRSLPLLAAVLGTTVTLGACGSGGGDDELDVGGDLPLADDPAGVQGDVADDDPGGVPDELSGDPVGAPDADEGDVGQGAATDPEAGEGTAEPDAGTRPDDPDADAGDDPDVPAGDVAPSGTATRLGVLSVIRGGETEDDDVFALFARPDEALPLGEAGAGLFPEGDVCTFDSGDGGVDAGTGLVGLPDLADPGLTFLSAGESIVLSGPAGTFATLPRTDAFGVVFYAPEGETLPGPIPSGLIADVPGDDFPAFASVRIPDTPPLTGVTPAGLAGVTADTSFGWSAGDDPEARVVVEVALVGPDPRVSISCTVIDDGEFRLPASLLRVIPAGQPAQAELTRVRVRALQRDDAVLLVTGVGTR